MTVDHLCRVTRCCNPAHLEVVTNRENVFRGFEANGKPRDTCKEGHPLSTRRHYDHYIRYCTICNRKGGSTA